MIKHIWTILCERVSIDRETNLLSYLTCIEEISAKQFPATHQILSIGSIWHTDNPGNEVLKLKVTLTAPDSSEIDLIEPKDIIVEKERHRTNIVLQNLRFEKAGVYIFKIKFKQNNAWITASEIPLKAAKLENG